MTTCQNQQRKRRNPATIDTGVQSFQHPPSSRPDRDLAKTEFSRLLHGREGIWNQGKHPPLQVLIPIVAPPVVLHALGQGPLSFRGVLSHGESPSTEVWC